MAGDQKIGDAFEKIRLEVLMQPRDPGAIKNEITAMRRKMREAHKAKAGQFDVKQGPGGMIDIEFIVQYFLISYMNKYQQLTENIGNIALLKQFSELSLMASKDAALLIEAYRNFRKVIHRNTLQSLEAAIMVDDKADENVLQLANEVAALWQKLMEE